MLTLKPLSKTVINFADIDPISVNTFFPNNDDGFVSDYAVQFSVNETQNLFIALEGLNVDFDIYLSSVYKGNQGRIYPYSNSTNYGTQDEMIFAQIPEGEYYLVIRNNNDSGFSFDDGSGVLTFDSKVFDEELALLPNDPLLGQQWHLFNKGYYALSNVDENEVLSRKNYNGILANSDIRAPEAWRSKYSASEIIVAVVDQGVEIAHPDLANNIWINRDEISGNEDDDDENGYDDDIYGWNFGSNSNNPSPSDPNSSHGTHVAGTIGATGNNGIGVVGVAWDVQIMPISVEDPVTKGISENIDEALRYASKNGADVVNMSFGSNHKINPANVMIYMTSDGQLIDDAPEDYEEYNYIIECFREAEKSDTLMVIAAGNEGSVQDAITRWSQIGNLDEGMSPWNFFGGFYDNAMIVASTDAMSQLSPWTNTGLTVDLSAPGGNTSSGSEYGILSTMPLGSTASKLQELKQYAVNQGAKPGDMNTWPMALVDEWEETNKEYFIQDGADYGYMQGTSMAAPVVSGAAALVKSVNPDFSASDVRQILAESASQNDRLRGLAGQNGLQLNLEDAVKLAEQWQGKQSFYSLENGTQGDDMLLATISNTWFIGLDGNDFIRGNKGEDLLEGGEGNDVLIPGEGRDQVVGGGGRDIIRYFHHDESPIARPDTITMESDDQIDLSALDGDLLDQGLQALKLIDTTEFTGQSGELLAKANGVFVDLDGDSFADFGLLFTKQLDFELTGDHFIL